MISNIRSVRNVKGLVSYLLYDESHSEDKDRVLLAKGVKCSLRDVTREILINQDRYNKRKNVEAYSIVLSWHKDELNADNPEDVELAMRTAEAVVDGYGGNRQAIIVLQNDGTNGTLHAHIVMSNVSLDGKCMGGKYTGHRHLKYVADKSQEELGILNKNAELTKRKSRETMAEIKMRERGAYVWKDDLKSRIDGVLADKNIQTWQDMQVAFQRVDVNCKVRNSKKDETGKSITFEFKDFKGKSRKARQDKLGADYSASKFIDTLKANREHAKELQRIEQERIRQQQLERERKAREELPEVITVDKILNKPSGRVAPSWNKPIQAPKWKQDMMKRKQSNDVPELITASSLLKSGRKVPTWNTKSKSSDYDFER